MLLKFSFFTLVLLVLLPGFIRDMNSGNTKKNIFLTLTDYIRYKENFGLKIKYLCVDCISVFQGVDVDCVCNVFIFRCGNRIEHKQFDKFNLKFELARFSGLADSSLVGELMYSLLLAPLIPIMRLYASFFP